MKDVWMIALSLLVLVLITFTSPWGTVMIVPLIGIILTKALTPSQKQPPGPKGWPIVGNLFQLGPHPYKTLIKLHEQYGPLVKLKLGSVNVITTCTPEIIKEILYTQDEIFANRPRTLAFKYLAYDGQDIALAPYGPHWKNMRRICMEYLLTTRRLESYQGYRIEEATLMIQEVWQNSKTSDGSVKVKEQLANFSMNVMTRMLLGKRFFGHKGAGAAEAAEFLEITEGIFLLLGVLNVSDYLPFLRPFDLQGYERRMRDLEVRMDAFHCQILAEHRAKRELGPKQDQGNKDEDAKEDFVDVLLSLPGFDGESHLQDVEMKALIQDMIAAAIDTSSVLSEWAMSELVKNPSILKKAQDEIDKLVGKDRRVHEDDLPHLNYLKCIAKETFRLHPSGPFIIPHEALKDTTICGYHVPKNTQVLVNVYALGRNPHIWSEKLYEFWPDRWMEDKVDFRDENLRILPFSLGRRKCPGAPLGQSMVLLALASLIHSFDWSLPPSIDPHNLDMTEGFGLTMPRAQPLVAIATPRLPSHLYQ